MQNVFKTHLNTVIISSRLTKQVRGFFFLPDSVR